MFLDLNDTAELPGGFIVWLTAEPRKWLSGRYVAAPWDVEALEKKRDEFEQVAQLALSVLALGLAERMLVDVIDGRERADSEVEFEMRYRLAER